jgi:transposase-like protein
MNFTSLLTLVQTKDMAIKYLQEQGILHTMRYCNNSHLMKLYIYPKREIWRCNKAGCRTECNLRNGTWLQNTHMSFTTVCMFIYAWAFEMTTFEFCKRELNIGSNETIVDWNHYLREVCAETLLKSPIKIGGDNLHVEIDESLFVRRKHNVGRSVSQQWVFGGYCRETRESFIYSIPDRTASTLIPIIADSVLPNSTIISDSWKAYTDIRNIPDRKYTHFVINHSHNFVDPLSHEHTNSIESHWAKAKIRNKRQWGTHRTMLDSYLCEFMWRQRNRARNPYQTILNDIVYTWPLE